MNAGSLPIMTYGGVITKGGSHAPTEFDPHLPAGPALLRSFRTISNSRTTGPNAAPGHF
jgi:hypothetical protein